MFLFWCYNKRTKIDKVYCLGLHHFTNENTICLSRKGIYSFYDGVMFTSLRFHVKKSNLERVITLNSLWKGKELYFYNQNLFYLYLLISRLYYIFENAIKNSRQEKFYEFLIAFFYRTLTAYYI